MILFQMLPILIVHVRDHLLLTIFQYFVLILIRMIVWREPSRVLEICHRKTNLLSGMTLLIWTRMICTSYLILRLPLEGSYKICCSFITNIFLSQTKNEIDTQYQALKIRINCIRYFEIYLTKLNHILCCNVEWMVPSAPSLVWIQFGKSTLIRNLYLHSWSTVLSHFYIWYSGNLLHRVSWRWLHLAGTDMRKDV